MNLTVYEFFSIFYAYLTFVAGVSGLFANILIIITYAKIGIRSSINTSYTAMAISDIGVIIFTMAFFCLTLPGEGVAKIIPIVPGDFLLYAGNPLVSCAKITGCITAYIALERCLCVAFPHKVKLLFTKKLTLFVLFVIFTVCAIPSFLSAFVLSPVWKVVNNRTVLGSNFFQLSVSYEIYSASHLMTGVILNWPPLVLIVICAIFLTVHLNRGSKFRLKSAATPKEDKSTKEDRLVQTVLIISFLSILFSVFTSANSIISIFNPDAVPYTTDEVGKWEVIVSNGAFMTMLNSCINIFVYYKLGTKFRQTLRTFLRLSNGEM